MENKIHIIKNRCERRATEEIKKYGVAEAEKARHFHEGFKEYSKTPLVELKDFSKDNGISGIYIKDESKRFGLNAFKVLGASYAIGSLEGEIEEDTVFVTATDGNHGRGVAWSADRMGKKSVVYLPKGTAADRLENIQALGSCASITDLSYDDAVKKARKDAEDNGWILIQDTSWDGYESIPEKIMQGYTTMALEAVEQLKGKKPTHVFLQAGVGSMAAAMTAFIADFCGDERPVFIIVEPESADCVYRTAEANDGKLHCVQGEMNTMMAGLSCGEPCGIAWRILKNYADYFVKIPDEVAAEGMRILYRNGVISGESGAAAFGLAAALLTDKDLKKEKNDIGLNKNSVVLCFSTEGDTDRENYMKVIRG